MDLPLIGKLEFKTSLQKRSRLYIPRLTRIKFDIDPTQILAVAVYFDRSWETREKFFAKVGKDGRITVPNMTCRLLKEHCQQSNIAGLILVVEVAPSVEVLDKIEDD